MAVGTDLEPVTRKTGAAAVTVAVPPDVEALGPGRRRAWRAAVRGALGGRLAAGAAVTGFLRHPDRYLVEGPRGAPVKLAGVELRRVALPLVTPFRTSFGVEQERDVLLVRAVTDHAEGWGECVAAAEPRYSSEYADGAADVLRRFLVPATAAVAELDPEAVGQAMAFVKGHRMAKAALELAVLDAWLRSRDEPLAG